ncbi:MAG: hypothetical protein AAFR26_08750 [Cyanobacteria bacterium J06626_4]
MSSTHRQSTISPRAKRRNRHKTPFQPRPTGKPRRTRSAGTR